MSILFNIIMLVIMVPCVIFIFYYDYPVKWTEKKYIFGIRNRTEFKEEKAAARVDEIVSACRKNAKFILIISLILMAVFCFIPDLSIRLIVWTSFVIVDLVLMFVPFTKGNSEMKSLKCELGIASKKGVVFTDLKGAGAIHALKKSSIIIPCVIATVFFLAALLNDIGVVKLVGLLPGQNLYQARLMTGMTGALLFISYMIIPIAFMMDGIRNEVISEDSDINANYNRAKKKNMADFMVLFTWINTVIIILMMVIMCIWDNQNIFLAIYAVYMLAIMIGVFIYAKRQKQIEKRYKKETSIEIDDDDNWILGQIYYNPDDKRLNITKRVGVGATVNMAHPVGKTIGVISILLLLFIFVELIYVGVLSQTPMVIRVEDGNLICHHMKDDYTIPISDIEDITMGSDSGELKLRKESGYNMEPMYKGKYNVNDEGGCIVFLNLDTKSFINVSAEGKNYYINGTSDEETEKIFNLVLEQFTE
ncbi:MAG: DUF5808 domain-containing protein [Eubacterium sp.]|nr:DUF5808 domain-containing protein [Eubacterium sp.]